MTSMVPVPMRLASDKTSVVWQNPRSGSTRYCRPIRFQQRAETKTVLRQSGVRLHRKQDLTFELPRLSTEIWQVRYEMCPTMLDGKASNAMQKSPDQSCSLCGAVPSDMNSLSQIGRRKVKEALKISVGEVVRGAGTSNDGNTSRKFFEDPKTTAVCTGLDEVLFHRLSVLLDALA
ncbi:hypothetical protein FOCC_FOCC007479, partial [Frankliniella occidentalis]